MTTTAQDDQLGFDDPGLVLYFLMATLGVTDTQLGNAVKVSRQTIHGRRTRPDYDITLRMLRDMAAGLVKITALESLPLELFFKPPAEALGWLLENQPHLFTREGAGLKTD